MSYLPVTDEQVRRRGKLWSVVAAVAIVLNLVILGWLLWVFCKWCTVCTLIVGILIARYAKRDLGLFTSGAGFWLRTKFIPTCSGFWLKLKKGGITVHSPESTPRLFASAFLVQDSGTDSQSLSAIGELPLQPTETATLITQHAKRIPVHDRPWKAHVVVAAVVTVLVIGSWIAYRDSRPASPLGTSALQRSNAIGQQVPFVPAKRVLVNSTSEQQVPFVPPKRVLANSPSKPQTARRRVRLGDNQVEYIGDDVTVHYFTPKHPVAPPEPVGSAAQRVDR